MRRWVAAVGLLVCAQGCSSGSSAPPLVGSGSGSGGGSSGPFVVSATYEDVQTSSPMQGVSICLLSSPSTCMTTSATGDVTMSVPGSGSGLIASFNGYVTEIMPLTIAGASSYIFYMRSTTELTSLAQAAGSTLFNGTTGAISFEVDDGTYTSQGVSGATVVTSPAGAISYFNAAGNIDSTLTATAAGGGFVFQVPAGNVTVTVTAPGLTCGLEGGVGWPASSGATLTAPVVANAWTRVHMSCH